jgi:flagellar basal-body rod protein FlgF
MLNRSIYTAMTGARASTDQLAVTSNNLSNAQTPGFKEVVNAYRAVSLRANNQADTRSFSVETTPGSNFTAGMIQTTGNPYDVAIKGNGFYAVRRPGEAGEAYTRAGNFFIDSAGVLKTGNNTTVLGVGGPITIPVGAKIQISEDGAVYTQIPGNSFLNQAGKLKIVNPPTAILSRAEDGLFEVPGGQGTVDPNAKVVQGAVELGNVNPTQSMIEMISQSRMFDLNIKTIQSADQNARSANELLSLSR